MKGLRFFCRKIPEWARKALLVVSAAMMMAVPAFATDAGTTPTFDLAGVMTTSVSKIVSDLISMISAVLPITVTLLALSIGITYAINFIKKIVKKAG